MDLSTKSNTYNFMKSSLIRICSKHDILGGFSTGLRINPHYQLHYICSGEGLFSISNSRYPVSKGDLLIWAPGEEHVIESDSGNPLTVIGIQFDLTHNFRNHIYPLVHYNRESFKIDYVNEIIEFTDAPSFSTYTRLHLSAIKEFYLDSIVHEYEQQGPFFSTKSSALLKCLLVEMLHEQSVHKLQHNTKNKNIQDIIDYLHLHYNEPLSNSRLGKHFGFHPNYLNHLVSEFNVHAPSAISDSHTPEQSHDPPSAHRYEHQRNRIGSRVQLRPLFFTSFQGQDRHPSVKIQITLIISLFCTNITLFHSFIQVDKSFIIKLNIQL